MMLVCLIYSYFKLLTYVLHRELLRSTLGRYQTKKKENIMVASTL